MELNALSSHLAREEQQGRNEKRVTSRNADKLRTTALDAIIIMRAIELHLERSHGLGSPAVTGRMYLLKKPDGRTPPLHTPPPPPLPVSSRTCSSQGHCHPCYPRPSGAVPPHTALSAIGGGLHVHRRPKPKCSSTF